MLTVALVKLEAPASLIVMPESTATPDLPSIKIGVLVVGTICGTGITCTVFAAITLA